MSRPASIFFDARTVRPGMSGVGRYAYNILAALATSGESPPLRAMFLPESIRLAQRDPALKNVELIEAPVSHESHPWGDWWLEYRLPRLLKPGELVHGPAFIIPGGRREFPRVATIHDLFVFTHAWAYPKKFALWLRWATRRVCRHADRIIVPSRAVADQLVERKLAPESKIAVIPYAPDTTPELWENLEGSPAPASIPPPNPPYFVTIATIDPRKDPATARNALVQLRRAKPGTAMSWIWIGGAGPLPDPSSGALIAESDQLGFRACGALPNAAARELLDRAAALVTCSHAEGFGIPLAEALAAGVPILASDTAVHREVAGDAALYFPVGDAAALTRLMGRLLEEPDLDLGLRAKSRARAGKFTWPNASAATLKVYQEAC